MGASISPKRLDKIAKEREDFMRRWFGIAVSVGFATTVVHMKWVEEGRSPDFTEWEQLCRLCAALAATVLSWEGYLLSIETKKLYEFPRYLLDIILVFVYLFLLLTSKYSYYWLFLHSLTFIAYIFWDAMSIHWHREWYKASGMPFLSVYKNGFMGREVDRGPTITIVWAIYFVWLWMISLADFKLEAFILAPFVAVGLAGYRYNKGRYRESLAFSYIAPLIAAIAAAVATLSLQGI